MRTLVFGATGYVGSHTCRHLQAAGYQVSGLARNVPAAERLRGLGVEPLLGDLDVLPPTLSLLEQADAVVFAPQLMLEQEQLVVRAMLDALAGTGKTFVFTSGTGVLAKRTEGAWDENAFAEDDPFTPSPYVGLRCETENLVRQAAGRGVRAMVVRPPLIWGNGFNNVIRALYDSARQTGAVCYMGAGLNLYSNIHVDDLAEIFRLTLEKGRPGALYHAVSGEAPYRWMAERAAKELGVATRSVTFEEGERIWGRFLALIAFSMCSRSRCPRTRAELGWKPHPDRRDILQEVADPAFRA